MNTGAKLTAGLSILATSLLTTSLNAGTIDGLTNVTGDGFVLLDEDENVVDPGINAITGDPNNDDFVGNGFSPSGVENCLRASVIGAGCAEGPGAGNRYKLFLTGTEPLDLTFETTNSAGVTEYFNFGKMSNTTGARIIAAELLLGTGTGEDFVLMDPASPEAAVLFDQIIDLVGENAAEWPFLDGATDGQAPLQRVFLPGGLFGDGGAEGYIGFFDDERAGMVFTSNEDLTTLLAENLANDVHLASFGDALLARTMIPNGMFWDENVLDTTDEDALIAWYDNRADSGAGGWVWGALAPDGSEDLGIRLSDLAGALGVDELDLGYADGAEIPLDIVALMDSDEIFTEGPIEDLSNLNLNFNIDTGDIALGEFTLRIVPTFAPIVEASETPLQFTVAGTLDAANVPYLNVDEAYLGVIDDVLALGTEEEQQEALDSLGHSFAGAAPGLAFSFGSDVLFALSQAKASNDGATVSTKGTGSWTMSETTTGFVSIGGGVAEQDATLNSAGYDADRASFVGGFETNVTQSLSAGVIFGLHNGEADIDDGLGSVDADGFSVAGFARYQASQNAAIQAVLGLQNLSFDTTRHIAFGSVDETATGSTKGDMIFAALDAEYLMPVSWGLVGPMASVEYYNLGVDGYTETGAGIYNLAVEDYDSDLFIGRIGLRGETNTHQMSNGWSMQAYGHAALATRSGGDFSVNAAFDGSNLPTMSLPSDGSDSEWVDVGIGVTLNRNKSGRGSTVIGAEYRGGFAGDGYKDHQGKVFVSWQF
ncbi:choice-of-anchor F family protein [Actibacterium pelagium]|uniref:Autotransporter domain-containing protein n=1 Tax=Actibacterium pelagium TaxID=2029103 RepID=A0A917AHJ1_9RHOB|nr:choice-of-anchor F family protein [Actibacterium pelagium]GGE53412.1 hypothetical protein GCM10011517_21420 [Actibacterium pelagium]